MRATGAALYRHPEIVLPLLPASFTNATGTLQRTTQSAPQREKHDHSP